MENSDLSVTIRIVDEQAGPERLVETALLLRSQIRELPVHSVGFASGGPAPPGTRGDAAALTPVLVAMVSSPVLAELIRFLQHWVTRERTIELTGPGGNLKITRASAQQERELIEAWLEASTTSRSTARDEHEA